MDRGRPYKCDSPRVVKSAIIATTDLVPKETTDYQNDNKKLECKHASTHKLEGTHQGIR